jgi:hypothetical protein
LWQVSFEKYKCLELLTYELTLGGIGSERSRKCQILEVVITAWSFRSMNVSVLEDQLTEVNTDSKAFCSVRVCIAETTSISLSKRDDAVGMKASVGSGRSE